MRSYISAIHSLAVLCRQLQNFSQRTEPFEARKLPVFSRLLALVRDTKVSEIRQCIEDNFEEEALKGFDGLRGKKENFIFLLKAQRMTDEFIEVQRITYSHTVEDIQRTFAAIREKAAVDLKLIYSQPRGYYIRSPRRLNLSELSLQIQDDIIQITEKGEGLLFSTTILLSLNNRLRENEKKITLACEPLLLAIISALQQHLELLFQISHALSMTDMILAFARMVRFHSALTFSRPTILDTTSCLSFTAMRSVWNCESRGHISEGLSLSLGSGRRMQVVQKEDNSLEQVNLLLAVGYAVILSQIGCFVPAKECKVGVFRTLVSKTEAPESIEGGLSHFQAELLQLRGAIDNASHPHCLVLLNQMAKGTQYQEELALGLACLDHLLATSATVLLLVSDPILVALISRLILPESRRLRSSDSQDDVLGVQLAPKKAPIEGKLRSLGFSPRFLSAFIGLQVREKAIR